ncbi:hypothetical protein ACHAWC_011820 [Mediolabrus comicus]
MVLFASKLMANLLLLLAAVSLFLGVVDAFTLLYPSSRTSTRKQHLCSSSSNDADASPPSKNGKTKWGQRTESEASRFLADFRDANGDIVDPYRSLRVSRSATLDDIKASYRKLSKKLHPDAVIKSNILPGKCSNLEEVRNEWEKVKFSYEILSDPKSRKSFDRNSSVAEVLEDPTRAVGRAVVGGVFTAAGMGFGAVLKVGEMAVKGVASVASPSSPANDQATNNVDMTNAQKERSLEVEDTEISSTISVSNNNQARVWTIDEMRAASSTATATNATSLPSETIPIEFDSNKAGTPIIRKEKIQSPQVSVEKVSDENMKMITPQPLSSGKKKDSKKQKTKLGNGKGFSKK